MTISLVLQASVILSITLFAGFLYRQRTSAFLHAMDTMAIICVLLLPLLLRVTSFMPTEFSAIEIPAISMTVVGSAAATQPINWMLWIERFYLAGVAAVVLRYAIGFARALWLRATSIPWQDNVRIHRSILVPMTFGWLRPLILLPESALDWPTERRNAAIAHENAHIARRDCLWNFLTQITCAVWWFHPLTWLIASRARKNAEKAADNTVLRNGLSSAEYAQHLLDVARSTAGSWEVTSGIAMAEPSMLESRVVAVLDPASPRSPLSRRALAVLGATMLLALGFVTTAIQGHAQSAPAGVIEITAIDVSGARTPGALISLEDGLRRTSKTLTADALGEAKFDSLAPGDYLIEVKSPGFAIWTKGVRLTESSGAKLDATLIPGKIYETMKISASEQPAASTPPQQIRIGGNVQAAKLISRVAPLYPAEAKQKGIQGSVFLQAVILKDGRIGALEVLSSPDESLSLAASEAVRQWVYQSTLLNGNPVEVITRITINFTLAP